MNADIMMSQIKKSMTSEVIRGHIMSSYNEKSSFSAIYFCLTPNLLKTIQECQHYEDVNILLNEV